MSKPKKMENAPETGTVDYTTQAISVDEGNGVVVFATDAPDGTGFSAKIDGEELDATAKDGQIWFYAARALRPSPIVELR